ncbi:EAL and HDOD domain-containing protein [Legionella micdadei]|uniref:HDOD domain-containing protein n=1 Tax=Legionella micdadei TaxID=451 RepID=A0A098GAW5_LEGMI|nr:HDOD domain-containing protein [Legionella micdadei]ARG96431.1 histidine kinase [Legionella micdadei]ARG99180.1 histidine kinase [Legionella micdadei]KTD29478.1 signal transduction protein [Legionella micdadei]NSL18124.1 HDOD domain-containing protein [Legionella micdadei]CEG59639.1 Signal transduction protein [Legionella micdadei]
MLVKRPIYNPRLECVGIEIIANRHAKEHQQLFDHFSALLRNIEEHFPLFIPYAFQFLIEQHQPPIKNLIILKLHAADINQLCPQDELEASKYPIALLIDNPQQLAWLNFADYIALTEHLMSAADVTRVVQYSQARERKVIAYDISSPVNFDRCKAMSMDYYCGDFLFQPKQHAPETIAANKLNLLELISKLQLPDTDLESVANLIQADPMLSYRLLSIANSVAFSGFQAIESIQQAVIRLGILNLKNWVMVLSMTKVSNKPAELVESGLIRAQMAQRIAENQPDICPNSAYTVGLLSVLDSLMDAPMAELIDKITLTDEIKAALLSHEGKLGELLSVVIAYEKGNVDEQREATYLDLDLNKIYIDCLDQITQSKKAMHETN